MELLHLQSKVRSQRNDNVLEREADNGKERSQRTDNVLSLVVNKEIDGLKAQVNNVLSSLILGKLAYKEEAAGKVRVFAIIDGWTQSLLSGLHKYLFAVLKQIEQDGTFNQKAPLERLQSNKNLRSF